MDSWVNESGSPDGDANLLGDEIEAGDLLGHAVLHLQTGVHLEEEELAVLEQHLDGARVHVTAAERDLHGRFAHRAASVVGDRGRGRFLDQLLVPALRGAVAVAQVHAVAVRVGEDLELDVARAGEVALHVALGAPEVRLRFAGGRRERRLRVFGLRDHLHAAAAAAVRRLDRDRVAVLLAERDDLARVGDRRGRAGHALDVAALAPRAATRSCRP